MAKKVVRNKRTLAERQKARKRKNLPPPLAQRRFTTTNAGTRTPHTTKADFVKALKDTGGVMTAIAENLGIARGTVSQLLNRADWADVNEEWRQECNAVTDGAETAIKELIEQKFDLNVRSTTARWYLSRKKREEYGDEIKTVHSGSVNTKVSTGIDIETLNLPIEVRKKILEAVDAAEAAKVPKVE